MSTRLHLRRIMHNGGPASTSERSEEEILQSFISLEGGKTFGRGYENKVILVEEGQNQEKGTLIISRVHAQVFHTSANDAHQYLVVDRSENGTYVNDFRLAKESRQLLQAGDLIKFGHKNAAAIQPGEQAFQPHADWTFRVETPSPSQVAMKQSETVRIFSNSPIVEQVDRDNMSSANYKPTGSGRATARHTAVQQREADSTNQEFLVEPQLFGTGASGHDVPSTSQSDSEYSSKLLTTAHRVYEQMTTNAFEAKLRSVSGTLTEHLPGTSSADIDTIRNIDLNQATTKEAKIQLICKALKRAQEQKEELTASSNGMRRQTDNIAVVDADSSVDVPIEPPLPRVSNLSAFHQPTLSAPLPPIAQPQPMNPSESDAAFLNHLHSIHVSTQFVEWIYKQQKELLPTVSMFEAARQFVEAIHINNYSGAVAAIRAHQMMFPMAVPFIGAINGGVIRSTNEAIQYECADENRHSASSGSTTHSNVRRRTESEESEILDVVGTDDQEEVDENDENEDPNHVHHFEYDAPSTDNEEEEEEENLNVGGTQTPSPMLSENIQQSSHALAERNVREAAEILRDESHSHSTTSTSAVPTPISSPHSVPLEPSSPGLPADGDELNELVDLQFEDHQNQEEKNTVEKAIVKDTEDQGLKHKPNMKSEKHDNEEQRAKVLEKEEEESEEKTDDSEEKVKVKANRESVVERKRKETAEQKKTGKAEVTNEKSRETRRMKQLDSEGSDSEADDGESEKTTVRRSTRGKPTTSAEEPIAAQDDDEDEDSDAPVVDSPESRKLKRKRNLKAKALIRKTVKKTKVAEDEEESDEPKKKRRVKKKRVVEEGSRISPKCAVSDEYCLEAVAILAEEEGEQIQWVQCETKDCGQWYHAYCVSLDNKKYWRKRNVHFYCCGPNMCVEAVRGRNGDVHREFQELHRRKGRR